MNNNKKSVTVKVGVGLNTDALLRDINTLGTALQSLATPTVEALVREEDRQQSVDAAVKCAEYLHIQYTALREEGFTDDAAMKLLVALISESRKGAE